MSQDVFSKVEFSSPSAAWRGKPFWSWNGKLEKDELIRQIHVLKEMGMGGYFMHSRTGLVTPYLGEEWFALTNACVEEGERLGMESWLYDEDRWPSGTAGGMVTANPEYRMKFIYMAKLPGDGFDLGAWGKSEKAPLGAWSCRLENEIDIYDVSKVTAATPAAALTGKTVLTFCVRPMAGGSFYNGYTYVDTMKRAATDEYIRLTHEAYKKHCGQHFGKGIKGLFTDEPHRGPFMSGFSITAGTCEDPYCLVPWTEAIFDTFASLYGTRVEESLPALFLRENGAPVSPVKAQYVETMLKLFLDNYAKPYYDWCDANNLPVTGHVLHENSLSCQVSTNGSMQRCYPLMHIPGIDYLGEHGRDYWVAKQVDSTARQFGQKWILSELYGCTGWQMNFESHKAIGAWQTLFGINLRCHHLSWYNMAGESKRDYPASIFHQSPWYKEYAFVETWFARLGYFRSQGTPCCDLLVLNPVESVWGRVYPKAITGMDAKDTGIKALEKQYRELFHMLAGNQIDFDYGDEGLLAEHGSVTGKDGRSLLRLGKMTYTTVLVSGVDTVRGTTLEMLKAFAAAGGRVIVAGTPPGYVDSLPSDAFSSLPIAACEFSDEALVTALRGHTPQRVCIKDRLTGATAREVFCQLRAAADGYYLTVLNMNRDHGMEVAITLEGVSGTQIEEWDLETGEAGLVENHDGNIPAFSTTLNTSQARCFRIVRQGALAIPAEWGDDSSECTTGGTAARCPNARLTPVTHFGKALPVTLSCASDAEAVVPPLCSCNKSTGGNAEPFVLDQSVRYSLADQNICVLDTPMWSVDGGSEQPVDEVLQVDRKVRQHFGVPIRAGDMIQPWFRKQQALPVLGKVTLCFHVKVDARGMEALSKAQLVMETPERFRVTINGKPVDTGKDLGWWVDVAFRRLGLPAGVFVEGDNEVAITCDFSEDINLEAIYLLGDFAVALDGTLPCLSALPETLMPSSIVDQGFPYYSGNLVYHYYVPKHWTGKRATVEIPAYEGAYVKVMSGQEQKLIPWRPNRAVLTLGKTLDVGVCITRKNTFGPLHLKNPRPDATGPGHFTPGPQQFSLCPVFIESGLLAPVRLIA